MTGKARGISGIVARGDELTIHLLRPEPEFPVALTRPAFCAVPSDTPVSSKPERQIPSAGPYYVTSYIPGQGVVLARNPNYRGSRPDWFSQIEVKVGVSAQQAASDVESGAADYVPLVAPGTMNLRALTSRLATVYGPGSRAAREGDQQFFVNPLPAVDYYTLNTHRSLFADVRMRRAVNYAIDRPALARLGDGLFPLPAHETDHYLPPGVPGYVGTHVYPLDRDVAKARALAHGRGGLATLWTCNVYPCAEEAQILKTDLAAIGIQLQTTYFGGSLFAREFQPGAQFDIGFFNWGASVPDPSDMLPGMLQAGPGFDDPTYDRQLIDAERLTGPARYIAYGKIDLDLARNAAPLLAYANPSTPDFFSARIGCQTYGTYGMDIDALCVKPRAR
jgi:peptide/nickel transport system substrate-binding protein